MTQSLMSSLFLFMFSLCKVVALISAAFTEERQDSALFIPTRCAVYSTALIYLCDMTNKEKCIHYFCFRELANCSGPLWPSNSFFGRCPLCLPRRCMTQSWRYRAIITPMFSISSRYVCVSIVKDAMIKYWFSFPGFWAFNCSSLDGGKLASCVRLG